MDAVFFREVAAMYILADREEDDAVRSRKKKPSNIVLIVRKYVLLTFLNTDGLEFVACH